MTKFRKRKFFQKSAWNIFSFIKIQLCAKNRENLMRGFLDIAPRTDERAGILLALIGVAKRPKRRS
jgi:hypothetical protein